MTSGGQDLWKSLGPTALGTSTILPRLMVLLISIQTPLIILKTNWNADSRHLLQEIISLEIIPQKVGFVDQTEFIGSSLLSESSF